VYTKKNGIWEIFSCFFDPKIFFKNETIRDKESIARISNASLTLNQGIGVCVLKRKSKIFKFSAWKWLSGVNLCGESIVRILEAWKRFPDSESGNRGVCIEAMTKSCYNTAIFLWSRVRAAFLSFGNARNHDFFNFDNIFDFYNFFNFDDFFDFYNFWRFFNF
jgi:hypothetical protein